ncbi:S-layer homology domain-containing protein [Paenibacillus sp. 1_12]|uniref:S-layer homology domain-containing protein n=1 Tax=Paenibacillus sp. 1_12 TaxID=1566278 RepID=UPI0008F2A3A7|nr:S-layer homology domain-containing protein [Paenibacillus sp. 1_12]SFM03747.1 S-layer homology domain-containing protein [Paenibacillus sp. 1_12]
MKYLKHMKKIINITLMLALLVSIIPLPNAIAATSANFFLPDDAKLRETGNMDITTTAIPPSLTAPGNLNRNTAKISNASTISIAGTFQQVTGTTLSVTVEQITSINGSAWTPQVGRIFNTSVGATNNRFQVANVQLFPGYNRVTFTGAQGASNKSDVFYVLYDSAPLINKLQITAGGSYDLNESADLVLTSNSAYIQGEASNAKTVTVNGQNATVLPNGLFYSPAITLTPGLNKFAIVLANDTDSVSVKRQVYYYDSTKPFNGVDVTLGTETQSIINQTVTPTFTGAGTTAELRLDFLVPYQSTKFDNGHADIFINGDKVKIKSILAPIPTDPLIEVVNETVINNTYGTPAYKKVILTTEPYNLQKSGVVVNPTQNVFISVDYPKNDPLNPQMVPSPSGGTFTYKLAANQTLVKNVTILTGYDGISAIDDNTPSAPFDGSQVSGPEFYVLVDASKPIAPVVAPTADNLRVNIQPAGTATLGVEQLTDLTDPAAPTGPAITGTKSGQQLYKITGLPEGAQTLAFSVLNGPVTFTGKITYVSKIYVDLENLYDEQVFPINSISGGQKVVLKGKLLGFGVNKINEQLIINNVPSSALTTSIPFTLSTMNADGSYDFGPIDLPIDVSGPLFTGRNTIKILVDYSDPTVPGGILRKYVKTVTFYVVDSNTPTIKDVRPLTPPSASVGHVNNLGSTNASDYLPASPEFTFNNSLNIYTTTLSKFDLYINGSGADAVTVRDGSTSPIFIADPTAPFTTLPGTAGIYESADFSGNRSDFRIRLNNVVITAGSPRVYTIDFTNASGAKVTQTLTVQSQSVPYTVLAPKANTGNAIIVNRNFVLFDVEAVGATDVQINGKSATLRSDIPNRYVYTLTGLKGDTENKISLVVKGKTADAKETITVKYVTNPAVGSMFMEPMGTKHTVFNKMVQLSFPKGNALRRVVDGKIEPQVNLLFGIADPKNGNTDLVNDYNQVVGTEIDYRTANTSAEPKTKIQQSTIQIVAPLLTQFANGFGSHFTQISDYYWISAGLGEKGKVGETAYKPATGGLPPYSAEAVDYMYTRYDTSRLVAPSDRGTLTLKYNADVVDQAAPEVTVYYLGNDGIWKNLGGEVNVKASTITVPFDNFGYYVVGKLKYGYEDISNHQWARNILQSLLAKGYMAALRSNEFGTSDFVSRGEFASLLVRALGMRINAEGQGSFIDVPLNYNANAVTWTSAEIETAARAGIVQGLNDQVFGVNNDLTRQDAAVMISRALNVKLAVNDDKLLAKIEKAFSDSDSINIYARPAIDALNSAGIMVGSNVISPIPTKNKPLVNFNPLSRMTRAEAGQVAVRLLQKYLKALPANL